ncbi:hypothetical protein GCM10009641_73630 [Mycobacterium cookii]|uniref:Chitin-binding type-2 domain-containing protein n=1 Tax=Mycobacterium cookii TaxID=1775 RepID=A0A7I7KQW3_9MYCO|nr:hypothetical protein MCOO_03480 [Mycobacterium cookii]
MRNLIGRLAGASLLAAGALAFATPSASWADPANCDPGQWWDPTSNVCRPLGQGPQPLNCPAGQWWDPNGNVCRDLGHTAAG